MAGQGHGAYLNPRLQLARTQEPTRPPIKLNPDGRETPCIEDKGTEEPYLGSTAPRSALETIRA